MRAATKRHPDPGLEAEVRKASLAPTALVQAWGADARYASWDLPDSSRSLHTLRVVLWKPVLNQENTHVLNFENFSFV